MAKGAAWKAWWERNKEHYRAKQREYDQARRPERVQLSPEERRERRRASVRRWRAANADRDRASQAAVNANRSAVRTGSSGRLTSDDVIALWTREPACVSCGNGRGIDHVIPLSQGGPNSPDNIQTMCQPCNSAKENASRALPLDHPNFERAQKARERRHRAGTGAAAL